MSRVIYLATTEGCYACSIMKKLLEEIHNNNLYTFSIEILDFKDIPEFIKINVPLNDFPTIIFVENNVIKYHHSGTISKRKLQNIINDLNFN